MKQGIAARYRVRVEVRAPRPLPREAFYPPRSRYRGDRLLALSRPWNGNADRLLLVTTADVSTTKPPHYDWGVFGLAQGSQGIVSTFRLQKGAKVRVLKERVVKVAVHEVGHTFGLPHCPTLRCVMNDAGGSIKTVDAEPGTLCSACASRVPAR